MLHSCGLLCTLQGGDSRAVLELWSHMILSQNAVQSCLHHSAAFLPAGGWLLRIGTLHSNAMLFSQSGPLLAVQGRLQNCFAGHTKQCLFWSWTSLYCVCFATSQDEYVLCMLMALSALSTTLLALSAGQLATRRSQGNFM